MNIKRKILNGSIIANILLSSLYGMNNKEYLIDRSFIEKNQQVLLKNMKKTETIEVVSYNPQWPQIFQKEQEPIRQALGDNCLAIHHFGSTSIPGCFAKPKVDILVVVHSLSAINSSALEKIGFEARCEVIPTGRYFSKEFPRVHVHVFEEGNPLIEKNLKFRDWLRAHREDRDEYSALKKKLAALHNDGMSYCYAKSEFVNKVVEKMEKRLNHELPKAISKWGWKFHHLGIPYDEPCEGETHHEHLKVYVMGFETSPYGVEWMRFEPDCPVPDILRKVPHIAFVVDDLDEALNGKEIVLPPGEPSNGIRTAMIIDDGALIELMEFKK